MKLFKNPENFKLEPYDMRNGKLSNLRMMTRNEKKGGATGNKVESSG